jgi:hypothetical protein
MSLSPLLTPLPSTVDPTQPERPGSLILRPCLPQTSSASPVCQRGQFRVLSQDTLPEAFSINAQRGWGC